MKRIYYDLDISISGILDRRFGKVCSKDLLYKLKPMLSISQEEDPAIQHIQVRGSQRGTVVYFISSLHSLLTKNHRHQNSNGCWSYNDSGLKPKSCIALEILQNILRKI